ncbi:MAG: SDR family oxidoreductase [SAR202 cluster bacterium]|jgi:NAD(P)-dependent dehydrogenase (short-subunit alcohol dehydrogenase family)|nr:SDR family oxidoreductase [SAR202 cluster bacterium]|tara:strand:- start:116 stop:922 length:807 start_codon:yes stop_codon:yes gene_type:complete
MLEALSLNGKTVVITGGGTGLGREMTLAMAKAGADLVIAARRLAPIEEVAQQVRAIGRRADAVTTDATDTESVRLLFKYVIKEFGKVDILFNNAGIVREDGPKPIWEITDESWKIGIDVNLSTAFYCSRAISKHMADRGSGKIVNVSSGYGFRGGRDNYMYAAGKGGIVNLTRAMATSLGKYGITTNCIVPGFIPTEITDPDSERSRQRGRFIPIGRTGVPREMGPLAVFLASSASDYMNGEFLVIDGGGLAGGIAPTGHAPEIPLNI